MNPISIMRPAALAGIVTMALGTQAAFAEPLVYVPLGSDSKILVIDAAKDKVIKTITGIPAVHGLAGTPDGKFLIAGSYEEREPGSKAPKQPSAVSKKDHAAHHSAKAAKSARPGQVVSTVSVLQTSDGAVVRRIDVPGAVHHVAVSPNGRWALVTHPNEGSVSAIDLSSYKVVASIATGPLANYAAFSPDSSRAYISNAGNDTVSEIDTARWIVRRNLTTGTSPEHIVLSRDGGRLFTANIDDGSVAEIATDEGAVLRTFKIGGPLHGLDLSKDGATLFVSALGQDKLVAIDLTTAKTRDVPLAPQPYHLSTIGNTGKLYIASAEEPYLWVVDQKTLAVLGKIQVGGKGHQMVLVPAS